MGSSINLHTFIQRLGLRDYGITWQGYKFQHEAVKKLYRIELAALFAIKVQQKLNRQEPDLFDQELNILLAHYGPQIWPTGTANRDHLLQPTGDSSYPSQLEYPRDTKILKDGLRGMILARQRYPKFDPDSVITRTRRHSILFPQGKPSRAVRPTGPRKDTIDTSHVPHSAPEMLGSESSIGTSSALEPSAVTSTRSLPEDPEASKVPFLVGVYLYSETITEKMSQGQVAKNPIWIEFPGSWISADYWFSEVNRAFGADCMHMVFSLIGHSQLQNVRVDQGHPDAQKSFNGVIDTICNAGLTVLGEYPLLEVYVGYS
ncbi:hypothetical protein IQ07DRAFT_644750 [Pyrenochaeta sp. DS3sAY3a]|nr:hypothetical protein IQ07DRAFT_644750 [Pyrenochaeta sp. DS3sAY3a]